MATGERIVPPSHMMAAAQGLCDAALTGMGWVLLPHPMAQTHLDSGALVLLSDEPGQ
jgi:DNA-binding transcriptional LysR family regulator